MGKEALMLRHSQHSAIRAAQRGLSNDEIEYVYQFASRYHRAGALIYYLRRQDLPPPDRCRDFAAHLVGTALICDPDSDVLITAWRDRRGGLKHIRRKEEYRQPGQSW
jgi:hypothetical protein